MIIKTISYMNYDECIVSEHKVIHNTFKRKKDKCVKGKNLYNEQWFFATEYTDFSFFPKN